METLRKLILFLVLALVAGLTFTACEKESNDIQIDYSKGIKGTWVYSHEEGFEVLVIQDGGVVISHGLDDGEPWQDVKGSWTLDGNRFVMAFGDGKGFSGTVELVAGETLAFTEQNSNVRIVYRYAHPNATAKFAGTWTTFKANYAEALQINADGKAVSTGVNEEGKYWKDVNGQIFVVDDVIVMRFDDGDHYVGRYEIVTGRLMVITDIVSNEVDVFEYCHEDLSQELVGMWACNSMPKEDASRVHVQTYREDGTMMHSGYSFKVGDFVLNDEGTYTVVGDLLIVSVPEEKVLPGESPYFCQRLTYSPYTSELGDVMVFEFIVTEEGKDTTMLISGVRVKESLDLSNKKYGYSSVHVTNVKGLDQDIDFMGFNFNFSKMDGVTMDKVFSAILFGVEFPAADTIRYSSLHNEKRIYMDAPIAIDGNKMTAKMSQKNPVYRDVDLYIFQSDCNSQLHLYMPTHSFVNFFANMQVTMMNQMGTIDLADTDAVAAIYKQINDAVETINVSIVLKRKMVG